MGDPKALEATKKAAMEKMANGRNIVFFPKPMGDDSDAYKFEVIEPGAMGLDIMQGIIENYFGGRLKRYILGQELSTEAKATGMGSGVAEAHMDTLSQIVNFDARNLEETLTHELVRYIQQLNFPETLGWHMRMSLKTEDDKTQERMEALNSAYQMGARIAESEVFKTLGLSAPTSGEKILSMQSQQPGGMPGMPGMDGMDPMGGMPPGEDPSADPESGGFPDQENNPEEEMSGDPMELIRSLMDQTCGSVTWIGTHHSLRSTSTRSCTRENPSSMADTSPDSLHQRTLVEWPSQSSRVCSAVLPCLFQGGLLAVQRSPAAVRQPVGLPLCLPSTCTSSISRRQSTSTSRSIHLLKNQCRQNPDKMSGKVSGNRTHKIMPS
jgi:hypothetical protein